MISPDDVAEALDRIARTPDGMLLYLSLQRKMLELPPSADSGALLVHHGERILASRIRALMSEGIAQSGRGTDQPITFAVAGPRAVSGSARGTRRRGPNAYPESDTDSADES